MDVGDDGGDRRKALSASGKAELDRLLDRVGRVAARIGEPHDLGAGALRLQQERSEIGGAEGKVNFLYSPLFA